MTNLLDHRVALHGCDDEFLTAAVPFLEEGIAADEPPPLMVSTPAKQELVRRALGRDARSVEFVSSADWYRGSAANALAQAASYIVSHGGRIHAIAEPDWTGRPGSSGRETAEWVRYEAMINMLLAPFAVTALCPYDTRVTDPSIVDAALRTHPNTTEYADPLELIASLDSAPLPTPPYGTASFEGDPKSACRFVREQALSHGLSAVEAGIFESAVAEVVYLASDDAVVRSWAVPGASVCEVQSFGEPMADPLVGFRPPESLEPRPGQGLWFTRQVCDYVDVRSGADDWTVRVQSRR